MKPQAEEKKRFFIHTLGCKVNQYETEAIRESLRARGFKECLTRDIADIYILNTCTVTGQADRESRHWIGLFHRTNPKARIVVTGCYVERDADDINFLPGVTHIVKNEDKPRIADILEGKTETAGKASFRAISGFTGHDKAFIKIQDGCENSCAYCKVPLVRGASRSRPVSEIVEEARNLTENGFRELVLTGICLGSWGRDLFPGEVSGPAGLDGANLIDVLRSIDGLYGDFRVRISSIEPKYVTRELIDYIALSRRVCKHLHIPMQSGDDEILKKMNRPYTIAEYGRIVSQARSAIPDVAISTDVMIGFPGETENHFASTVDAIRQIRPMRTHIFTFSRRKGTAAYDMGSEIDRDTQKRRFHKLNAACLGASFLYRETFLGKTLDVLVESRREKHSGLLTGYSDNYIKVSLEGPDSLMGSVARVKIKGMTLLYTLGVYGEQ